MTTPNDVYDNPLIGRYASKAMSERWGPLRKFRTWRRLWLALAEAESELRMPATDGVTPRITPDQLAELRAHLDDIDLKRAAEWEKKKRHDVMAHIETLAEVAPKARDIIHLGATSCYVTDNADLILMRESCIRCARRCRGHRRDGSLRTAVEGRADARVHALQPAQLTTWQRACLWLYDLTLDLQEWRRDELPSAESRARPARKRASSRSFAGTTRR